ncbi:adenosylcobinamide-GDP ribazoletransferase [Ramlibacter sp. USB13]|uniref:Adenosylcobinamide-GDP ribazoletransferase n=1 Tax=Ramlibacter cellulosilyticus TaxID=2764187 RepID=A0A923MTN3_9BURK|nr:adenosylcobinamide-GDP ribazoletransferase [Ramlibacter cellulosilyticus]MBC5785048.1 adenosylcobinamide-GDP ribazoletransferase [Ramlibacter cellulosilyticus]
MATLREHLDLFALALHRATVLRVGTRPRHDPESVRASDAHLPGAGWVVGLAACLVFALVGLALRSSPWGAAAAAVAAMVATATLTRGRGETGLFRTAERLQGLAAPGTSGAGALVLWLLLTGKLVLLAALASLSESAVMAALFAAQVLSRVAPLLLARSLDGDVPPRAIQVGLAWCVVPLVLLFVGAGLFALLFAVAAAVLACYGMWRLARLQAEPGDRDALAASQLACEVAIYLGTAIGL